ncbi:NAD(P)/FAD-dependent oxidoreductase [Actinokineospora sp. NPDC004072]
MAVVGAGPAGAAAAIAALRVDPGARVVLLDAADFPRDKVCGDGVAPHAVELLAGLGVTGITAGTAPVTRLRLVSPGGVEAARSFARPAYVVPRAVLDHRLVQAAQDAGAVLRRRRVRTVRQTGDAVLVDGDIRARVVIGADGAESVVRRQCGARAAPPGTTALAVRGYAPSEAWPAAEQLLVLDAARWPAYAWVFPIGDGTANIGYGEVLRDPPPTRAQLTDRLHHLLPACPPLPLRGHRLPLSPGRPAPGRGRILLAGDAASLINPLTGEGIHYAVLSGILAGEAALTPDPARAYRRSLRAHLSRHLRHTDLLARLTRRPWPLDLATTAAARDQRAFDQLTEIGLGTGALTPHLLAALALSLRQGRPHR